MNDPEPAGVGTPDNGPEPMEVAKRIADWCEEEAERCQEKASDQFRLIVWVIGIGLILLLVLPLLIGKIDLWAETELNETPANQVIESVQSAVADLGNQIEKTNGEVNKLNDAQSEIRSRLNKHSAERNDLVNKISKSLSAPLGYWETLPLPEGRFRSSAVAPRGTIVLGGSVKEKNRDHVILLSSTDGTNWKQNKPLNSKGEWLQGEIIDIAVSTRNQFVAVGMEDPRKGRETPLILHSRDGKNWSRKNLKNSEGKPFEGVLANVTISKEGKWIATGIGNLKGSDDILILSSKDGSTWTPIPIKNSEGKPLKGAIGSVSISENGTWVAVGEEQIKGPDGPIILTSSDGENWVPLHIPDSEGNPMRGGIMDITTAKKGLFVAVGEEDLKGLPDRPLILTSIDGKNWNQTIISDSEGNPIKGKLSKVWVSNKNTLVAAGLESTKSPRRVLILTSTDGKKWQKIYPVTPTGNLKPDRMGLRPSLFSLQEKDKIFLGNHKKVYVSSPEKSTEGPWKNLPSSGKWNNKPHLVEQALQGIIDLLKNEDSLFPEGTIELGVQAKDLLDNWQADLKEEGRISSLLDGAEKARDQQTSTLEKVKKGTEGLEKAHKELKVAQIESDKLTRASQIATRVAIVGLLIYLVQIVVNRYRYLQKLSGFYRGRSQALQIMISLGKHHFIDNAGVMDLMTGLSPDGIGFDKAAEPPTQTMMNLVRDGLRFKK